MNIVSVIGARPHFMKVKPMHDALILKGHEHIIVHTGQHYDYELSQQFVEELELPPIHFNLAIQSENPVDFMGQTMSNLENLLLQIKPAIVLVYGDTNSTAAAAICTAKMHIPLAHIEAGLREHNRSVPEEINKLLIDSVSNLLFAPTERAMINLKNEGKSERSIFTGDVVYDLVAKSKNKIEASTILQDLDLMSDEYYFVTCHRAHNTDNKERLSGIIDALLQLDKKVVWSLHPRTKKALRHFRLWNAVENSKLILIDSKPFWATQNLIYNSHKVLTDSGGISKESYFHGKQCILLDDQIEWQELIETDWLQVSGTESKKILACVNNTQRPLKKMNIFGNGNACELICNHIDNYFKNEDKAKKQIQ